MSAITFPDILPQAERQYYNMLNDYDKDILREEYPRTYLKNGAILFIPEDIYWLAKAIFWGAGKSDEARKAMAWEIRSYRESQEGPTYKDVVTVPGEYSPKVTDDDLLKETIRDDAQWDSWDRTVWIATDVAGAPDFDNPLQKQSGEVLNPNNYPISDQELWNALLAFSRYIGKPVVVTGGDRSGDTKYHGKKLAADIKVEGQHHIKTANQAAESGLFTGIGWYEEGYYDPKYPNVGPHVHVDIGTDSGKRPARWGYDRHGKYYPRGFPKY